MSDLALVQGMRETRSTLAAWNRRPGQVIGLWLAVSLAVTLGLLAIVWLIAVLSTPDPTGFDIPGLNRSAATLGDAGGVLYRNGLVLALHGFACVAGFIAGSSLPEIAKGHSGLWRWVHEKAGPLAIAFVIAATTFSLVTQAYALGIGASTLAAQLGLTPLVLLLGLAPHAIPELTALFLPLAAWLIASRRRRWNELLAATLVTVTLAAPVLIAASMVEVYFTPRLLAVLAGL